MKKITVVLGLMVAITLGGTIFAAQAQQAQALPAGQAEFDPYRYDVSLDQIVQYFASAIRQHSPEKVQELEKKQNQNLEQIIAQGVKIPSMYENERSKGVVDDAIARARYLDYKPYTTYLLTSLIRIPSLVFWRSWPLLFGQIIKSPEFDIKKINITGFNLRPSHAFRLIEMGANPNALGYNNESLLNYIAGAPQRSATVSSYDASVVLALLHAGADIYHVEGDAYGASLRKLSFAQVIANRNEVIWRGVYALYLQEKAEQPAPPGGSSQQAQPAAAAARAQSEDQK